MIELTNRSLVTDADNEAALAEGFAADIGIDHARSVAQIIVSHRFTAEEIFCVNGYVAPHGDPELVALAGAGWPLRETNETMERWADERDTHKARDEFKRLRVAAVIVADILDAGVATDHRGYHLHRDHR